MRNEALKLNTVNHNRIVRFPTEAAIHAFKARFVPIAVFDAIAWVAYFIRPFGGSSGVIDILVVHYSKIEGLIRKIERSLVIGP